MYYFSSHTSLLSSLYNRVHVQGNRKGPYCKIGVETDFPPTSLMQEKCSLKLDIGTKRIHTECYPASILLKFTSDRYRSDLIPVGPMQVQYRFK